MNWFEIIKADSGKQGKHLTKVYAFLKRFFGNPPDNTEIKFDASKYPTSKNYYKLTPDYDMTRTENFDKYYATIDELFSNEHIRRFSNMIRDFSRCFQFDDIYYDFPEFKISDSDEIIPGFFFTSNNEDTFTIKFMDDRHIALRDLLYRENDKKHHGRHGRHGIRDKKYNTKEDLEEELNTRTSYWQRHQVQQELHGKRYGFYDACLQQKYTQLDNHLKMSKNFWYSEQRRRNE